MQQQIQYEKTNMPEFKYHEMMDLEKQKSSQILQSLYTLKSDLNKTSNDLDYQSDVI